MGVWNLKPRGHQVFPRKRHTLERQWLIVDSHEFRDPVPEHQTRQRMAELTMNHGVTHLYVGKRVAAQLMAMPSTVFQPAGIAARPGIYRLGRLFGQYEVYYTPKILAETADSSQILCVGRATDVTRNPIVLGDAVAPMVVPLGVMGDLRQGAAFYARNFTEVNPHDPSSKGFGLIEVKNLAG